MTLGEEAGRLAAAAVLGAAIGLERELAEKNAGLRTHTLVALGAALFTVVSIEFSGAGTVVDPSRVASQVVTGIGFLGAGAILKHGLTVQGLTTAATLWVTASIGMAAALGRWWLAVVTTGIALSALLVLGRTRVHAALHHRTLAGTVTAQGRAGIVPGILSALRGAGCEVQGVSLESGEGRGAERAVVAVRTPREVRPGDLLSAVRKTPGVAIVRVDVESLP